jgi:hypothetical protein
MSLFIFVLSIFKLFPIGGGILKKFYDISCCEMKK